MFSPRTDRMALGPETMGPGRSQVLGPGQEKDDLRVNTDPPAHGLELGLQRGWPRLCALPAALWSLGEKEPEWEWAEVGDGGQRESDSK